MGRSIGAVLAGMVLIVALSVGTDQVLHATGVFPPSDEPMSGSRYLLALAYRLVFGIAGGWLTARLSPGRPIRHAVVLGAIGTLIGALGAAATWNQGPEFGPKWYAIAVAATALPCTWVGARMNRRTA